MVSLLAVLAVVAAVLALPTARLAPTAGAGAVSPDRQVLAISVDALNPAALRRLGRSGAPHLWRLLDEGVSTLNARSQRELTLTLPNHASMVTGRRIDAAKQGHGVTWNDDGPGHPLTVQEAAGSEVESLFSVAHDAGLGTALFAAKTKFSVFERSWPDSIDVTTIREERDGAVARAARRDLLAHDRGVTFVHLGQADRVGHAHGFLGDRYLSAVRRADRLVGTFLRAAETRPRLDDLTIVLTSDHGGVPGRTGHSDPRKLANHRVPFAVWGPGIAPGDLYDLNPDRRDPGRSRSSLVGDQPVRNGDVANVVLGVLGLGPVPGSRFGADDPLLLTSG